MKQLLIEATGDFLQSIYDSVTGDYPAFMLHRWEDKASEAKGNPGADGATEILAQETRYHAGRKALADAYELSLYELATNDDTELLQTANGIMARMQGLVMALISDEEKQTALLASLTETAESLTEISKNG